LNFGVQTIALKNATLVSPVTNRNLPPEEEIKPRRRPQTGFSGPLRLRRPVKSCQSGVTEAPSCDNAGVRRESLALIWIFATPLPSPSAKCGNRIGAIRKSRLREKDNKIVGETEGVAVKSGARADPTGFIQAHMRVAPAPSLPEIRLHTAHPASGLWRLVDRGEAGGDPPPYWAYHWAGGLALARYILDRPATVAGLCVLDLGAGSGVVGIAAAKAGARKVIAVDTDRNAIAAIALNAAANDVIVETVRGDLTAGAPPKVDIITVGDLFYEQELAARVTSLLDSCRAAGIRIFVGDPGRPYLPRWRLRLLAEGPTPDFGNVKDTTLKMSAVFSFESDGA
jgi:predicted nicotinamide N-methyase